MQRDGHGDSPSLSTDNAQRMAWLIEHRPGVALRELAEPLVRDAAPRGDGQGVDRIRRVVRPFTEGARSACMALGIWRVLLVILLLANLAVAGLIMPSWFALIVSLLACVVGLQLILRLLLDGRRRDRRNSPSPDAAQKLLDELSARTR